MGQSDMVPGANEQEKVPAEQRDAVTTDHTIQNPAQAPGEVRPPDNTAGIRRSGNQAEWAEEDRKKAENK